MHYNIALAEDKAINRNTFLQKMSQLGHLNLVFVAPNGSDCIDALRTLAVARLPQVVFMDLEMPIMGGIEAIAMGKMLYPHIHFIVLTVFDDDEKIFEAIKAGATGYLMKHEPAEVLGEAVVDVVEFGGAPMSPAIARKALQLISQGGKAASVANKAALPQLITHREEEILKLMVNGWDAKRIGDALDISVHTVRKHTANIYEKLHVQSKAEIISMAHHQRWF
ncbi:MAG: DNA-binding response regulator [Bacteroidetes bacterium]|nr:MAG: DNA-binding response regulator [Bacteroidota bacterium]